MEKVDIGMIMLIVYMVTMWTVGIKVDFDRKHNIDPFTELYLVEGFAVSAIAVYLYIHGGMIWDILVGN